MADRILEVIESPTSHKRLVIVQREDGRYSFRMQGRTDDEHNGPGKFVWPDGYREEAGWQPPGPYLGIYDSPETAKWEAMGKVDWVILTQSRN
ncbi:MAG: hypothetical protein R3D05_18590 [Dongiaceae bacterium]